jgi:serine/threonine protein kinase
MDVTRRVVAGWILEERLGSGGFGEVWKARRRHVDLFRALKLVPVSDDRAFTGWRHEIGRLEALSHPNIVRFYDADVVTEDGPYRDFAWIATELCVCSLADELARRPRRVLSPPECAGLLDAMLAALAAAHEGGCVHRDIKPGNILWHATGVWKLCDFGTARLVPHGASHPPTGVVGTSPYMSAAAHRGRQDGAADLYALGVTVHEALTGARLHPRPAGMTDSEYVKLILDTPPVISPRLDQPWHDMVAALIGAHGPVTARELRTVLRRDLQGELRAAPRRGLRHEPHGNRHHEGRGRRWDGSTGNLEVSGPDRRNPASATRSPRGTTARSPATSRPSPEDTLGERYPPTVRQPHLNRSPDRRDRRRERRRNRSRGGSGVASLVALVVLIFGSSAVAGILLYSLIPNPVAIAGIVVGVALITMLLMAVF